MDDFQKYIHISKYSRWIEDENRRETWEETVQRYVDFFESHLQNKYEYTLSKDLKQELYNSIHTQRVMPSMRALMTAGEALEKNNIAGYNCSYVPIDNPRSFDEIMVILMHGTGVGFSVESKYISKLPEVAEEFHHTDTTIAVSDSRYGWAKAYKEMVALLYQGLIPKWDVSKVRPAGERLKTFGGRASGPQPLVDLFVFTVETFKKAAGRKLRPLECHDIVCKIGDIVVSGGVRRSALISLSDLSDDAMRHAKSGTWWETNPQRALANNSVAYESKPEIGTFMREWLALYDSKSGERGIFNVKAVKKQFEKINEESGYDRRKTEGYEDVRCNPCAEILLRPRQFCNLSEVVIRENDTLETLKDKVRLATILGTFQSTLTDFKYLSKEWTRKCEEERLLGVSLTGIMDNKMTSSSKNLPEILTELKRIAVETNKELAEKIGINPAAAITCVKPSGTVSSLVNSASGIHARHSDYYIRTVRQGIMEPLTSFMQLAEMPNEPDVMKPESQVVFSFPVKSPKNSVKRSDMNAIDQLEVWLTYQRYWCEHKPSVTISVKENEWLQVGSWVYEHFNEISGISFLPHSDHVYKQAPFQECSKEEYDEMVKKLPKNINWNELSIYESEDTTTGSKELACSAGACEIL